MPLAAAGQYCAAAAAAAAAGEINDFTFRIGVIAFVNCRFWSPFECIRMFPKWVTNMSQRFLPPSKKEEANLWVCLVVRMSLFLCRLDYSLNVNGF